MLGDPVYSADDPTNGFTETLTVFFGSDKVVSDIDLLQRLQTKHFFSQDTRKKSLYKIFKKLFLIKHGGP